MRTHFRLGATLFALGVFAGCSTDESSWGGASGSPSSSDSDTPGAVAPDASNGVSPGVGPNNSGPATSEEPSVFDMVEPGDPIPLALTGSPNLGNLVRLTHQQWSNSVQALLKLSAPPQEVERLVSDVIVGNFSNNEKYLTTTQLLVSEYERAAESLVEALTDQALARIHQGTDAEAFITAFGRRAYRRPLTAEEVARYTAIYTAGTQLQAEGSDFLKGAGLVIQTMLQSPFFLYRTELEEPGQALNGYEIAAKLSLSILDVTPDDALLDAAKNGQLDTTDAIAAKATELLNDPRAVTTMRRFHDETLQFKRFDNMEKDTTLVPDFHAETTPAALKEAAYLFFDRIFSQDLGLKDVFTTTVGFVNAELAPYYDLTANGSTFQQQDLGPSRMGYFSQVPYLVMHSVNDTPDSIHRGVDLNLKVLCAEVETPNFVPPALPAPEASQSNREVVEAATGSAALCAGCHSAYINPLGFAFENFDGSGRWRTEDKGKAVNATGTYPFTEGDLSYSNNQELMNIMVESQQAHDCYAKNLAQFTLGRELRDEDMDLVKGLGKASKADASVKELFVDIVKSDAFRKAAGGN